MNFEYVAFIKRKGVPYFLILQHIYLMFAKTDVRQLRTLPRWTERPKAMHRRGSGGLHRRYNCMEIKSGSYREAYLCPR